MVRLFALLIAGAGSALLAGAAAPPPVLSLPIACAPGRDCFVQQGFDHDPGPRARDHRCGARTYDGHDGVDIRLPTIAAQRRGVTVLAAADGTVRGVRGDAPDRLAQTDADRAAIAGKECGNGVVLVHPGGWETQYCHMAAGSISVRPGEPVRTGQPLGRVGLSGNTQFPHLHFSVRHHSAGQGTRKVDPFRPLAPAGSCAPQDGPMLWDARSAAALAWRESEIINAGFSDAAVSGDVLEQEGIRRPDGLSPALVGYARVIGLSAGATFRVTLNGPRGEVLATNSATADRNKAQYLAFAGKRRPPGGWPVGRYVLVSEVVRGGRTIAARSESIDLR